MKFEIVWLYCRLDVIMTDLTSWIT